MNHFIVKSQREIKCLSTPAILDKYSIFLGFFNYAWTFTPGPIVEEIAMFLTNVPLTVEGFSLEIRSIVAWMFSTNLSSLNETLPTPSWMLPAL